MQTEQMLCIMTGFLTSLPLYRQHLIIYDGLEDTSADDCLKRLTDSGPILSGWLS